MTVSGSRAPESRAWRLEGELKTISKEIRVINDKTLAYLRAFRDVIVVGSDRRYSDIAAL